MAVSRSASHGSSSGMETSSRSASRAKRDPSVSDDDDNTRDRSPPRRQPVRRSTSRPKHSRDPAPYKHSDAYRPHHQQQRGYQQPPYRHRRSYDRRSSPYDSRHDYDRRMYGNRRQDYRGDTRHRRRRDDDDDYYDRRSPYETTRRHHQRGPPPGPDTKYHHDSTFEKRRRDPDGDNDTHRVYSKSSGNGRRARSSSSRSSASDRSKSRDGPSQRRRSSPKPALSSSPPPSHAALPPPSTSGSTAMTAPSAPVASSSHRIKSHHVSPSPSLSSSSSSSRSSSPSRRRRRVSPPRQPAPGTEKLKRHRQRSSSKSVSVDSEDRHRRRSPPKKSRQRDRDHPDGLKQRSGRSPSSPTSHDHTSRGSSKKKTVDASSIEDVVQLLHDIKNTESSSDRERSIRDLMDTLTDPQTFAYETADAKRHSPESFVKMIMHCSSPVRAVRQIFVHYKTDAFCFEAEWFSSRKSSLISLYVMNDSKLTRCYEFEDTAELGKMHPPVDLDSVLRSKVWLICRRYLIKKGVAPGTQCRYIDMTGKTDHSETFAL